MQFNRTVSIMFRFLCVLLLVSGALARIEPKIVGGYVVNDRTRFSYQAFIQFDDINYSYCGGTILNENYILTAAHCFDGVDNWNNIRVIVGNLKLDDRDKISVAIDKVIIHENYDDSTATNDVAVIKLSQPLEFTDRVNTIPLNTEEIEAGTRCVVSGWGVYEQPEDTSSNELRAVEINMLGSDECEQKHSNNIKPGMICAGAPNKDSCQNDSGGPLVCDGTLAGIVSWGGKKCGDPHSSGVYTSVSYFSTWIKAKSAGNSISFTPLCIISMLLMIYK